MPNETPQSRPEPPPPTPSGPAESPSPYGGQWGSAGKQNSSDPAEADPRSGPQPKSSPN
jgi:hypothetical protein